MTTYTYNLENQKSSQKITIHDSQGNPVTATTAWTYDSAGNLQSQVDSDNRTIVYGYDALNRETSETWYDPQHGATATELLNFLYDSSNRLTFEGDSGRPGFSGQGSNFAYDNGGRLVSATEEVSNVGTVQFAYKYNGDGFQTQTDVTINAAPDYTNVFTPDALDRVHTITQTGTGVAPKSIQLDYDPAGNLSGLTRYKAANQLNANIVRATSYQYDDANRITSITHFPVPILGGAITYSWQYQSGTDLVHQLTSTADGTTTYGYDDQNQLISATHTAAAGSGLPTAPPESFSYDANGNRTAANGLGYTETIDNRIQSDGTFTYSYDAVGNRTGRVRISYAAANDYQTIYSYDNRNRLVDVLFKNNAGTKTKEVAYVYDAENQLIHKTVTPYSNGVAQTATTQRFVYDQGNLALAFNGAGALTNRYLSGPGVDQILADEVITTGGQPGAVYWPLADNQGTIRDIADSTGAVVDHLSYDSFGNLTHETGTSSHTVAALDEFFGYTGGFHDPDTGLVKLGERWYDPATGDWLSKDPIGFAGGDSNTGRYAGNDTPNATDQSGLAAGGYMGKRDPHAISPFAARQLMSAHLDVAERIKAAVPETILDMNAEMDAAAKVGADTTEILVRYSDQLRVQYKAYADEKIAAQHYVRFIENMPWNKSLRERTLNLPWALPDVPAISGLKELNPAFRPEATRELRAEARENAATARILGQTERGVRTARRYIGYAQKTVAVLAGLGWLAATGEATVNVAEGVEDYVLPATPDTEIVAPINPNEPPILDETHPIIEGVIDTPRTLEHMRIQEALAEGAQESGLYSRISRGSINLSDFSGLTHSPDIKPDFMGLTTGGQIDMIEIRSPSQRIVELEDKLNDALGQLPPTMRGEIKDIDPEEFLK